MVNKKSINFFYFLRIKMMIQQFKVKQSPFKSWKEIFHNPCDVTLKSFKTGTVKINRRGTINTEHPDAGYIKDEVLSIPIIAHLIHHNELGYFLLDAGLDISYAYDPKGGVKGSFADEFIQGEGENIGYHLDKLKIKLNGIFLSHLHSDHIAGVRELPKNIPYIIAKGELEDYEPGKFGDFLSDVETFYEINFSEMKIKPPLGPCADLLGDGSVWAVSTPGHSKAHTSFLINSLKGPIFLTMDAAFIMDNLKLKIAPSDYTWNVDMAQKSLEQIISFLEEYPEVRVRLGHEF
jgi:glyoxylase-like metal-dependent hydrolase (beta-lactamase superfamily II)